MSLKFELTIDILKFMMNSKKKVLSVFTGSFLSILIEEAIAFLIFYRNILIKKFGEP